MGSMNLTVFLRHEQSKGYEAITAHLRDTGWWEKFPPECVEIVSWMVVANIGQIVTLSFDPELLSPVVFSLEQRAWGAFTTEIHVSYDYLPIRRRMIESNRS